jgi:hypothetical protein
LIRALGQLFFENSFVGQHLGLLRLLLLLLLLMCSLELQKRHPLRYTYCMNAQINFMDA